MLRLRINDALSEIAQLCVAEEIRRFGEPPPRIVAPRASNAVRARPEPRFERCADNRAVGLLEALVSRASPRFAPALTEVIGVLDQVFATARFFEAKQTLF